MVDLDELLSLQSGVVSRRQALAAGLKSHDIRRLRRRREWAAVHPAVYIRHTGPLTWLERAWAAVLAVEPAALTHASAIRATDGPGRRTNHDGALIHVAVDRRRRALVAPDGVRIHHLADLSSKVLWNASPPRVRFEHAAIDVAAESRDDLEAVASLADAVQARRTTPVRLRGAGQPQPDLAALTARRRARRPRAGCLLGAGAEYLVRVERAHGLPPAARQVVDSARGPLYRDVEYRDQGVIVELDGRLFHDNARARDRDLERDLDAALTDRLTLRIG